MNMHKDVPSGSPLRLGNDLHRCVQVLELFLSYCHAFSEVGKSTRWLLVHMRIVRCEDLPLPLAHESDKKVKRFHFSEIIGRLPYMRATVTYGGGSGGFPQNPIFEFRSHLS
jgi:hypothetical protein